MEPFRSLVADSCVIQVVNNGEVRPNHFVFNGPACSLKPPGRKALIAAFERRLEQVTTHPLFGYRVSMRRLIEVEARADPAGVLNVGHFPGELARASLKQARAGRATPAGEISRANWPGPH